MRADKKMVRLAPPRGVWHVKAKGYTLTMCWRRIPLGVELVKLAPDVFGRLCQVCAGKIVT